MAELELTAPFALEALPAGLGAYILEILLPESLHLKVGRLSPVTLQAGRYRYYGSACGPGGLQRRLARHLRRTGRRDHWHIDHLTRLAAIVRIRVTTDADECSLLQRDLASGAWQVAVPGFGSSDCRQCPTHLLRAIDPTCPSP